MPDAGAGDGRRRDLPGPVDPQGRQLYPGGLPLGSEWAGASSSSRPRQRRHGADDGVARLRRAVAAVPALPAAPPGQLGPDPDQWKFTDRTSARCSRRPTRRRDGHQPERVPRARRQADHLAGMGRPGIPPFGTVDYYDTLTQRMGGLASTAAVRADVPVPDGLPLRRRLRRQQLRPGLPDGPVGRGRNRAELSSTIDYGRPAGPRSRGPCIRIRTSRSTTAAATRTRRRASMQFPRRPPTTRTGSATTCSTSRSAGAVRIGGTPATTDPVVRCGRVFGQLLPENSVASAAS